MKKFLLASGAMVVAALLTSAAQAGPVKFTYTGTVGYASTPGVNVGDTYTLSVYADNGGSSLANQTWGYDDLQGFTIQSGSYSGSYSKVWESSTGFSTDGDGNVVYVAFYGTSGASNNTDNFGSWTGDTVFGDGAFYDFFGRGNGLSTDLQDPTLWHVSAVGGAVPEPASWALMLGGFGFVGGAMRSRRRTAVSFG